MGILLLSKGSIPGPRDFASISELTFLDVFGMLSDNALGASGCSRLSPTHLHDSTLVSHLYPICLPSAPHCLPVRFGCSGRMILHLSHDVLDGCDIGIDMARESKPGKNEIKNGVGTLFGEQKR